MVCYITPLSHQLRLEKEKNERLEKENAELKLKLETLEHQMKVSSKSTNTLSTKRANDAITAKSKDFPPKSYLRATVSSSKRSKPVEPADEEKTATPKFDITYHRDAEGRVYAYDDGRLIEVTHLTGLITRHECITSWVHKPTSYMQDTESSRQKVVSVWRTRKSGASWASSWDCMPTLVDSVREDSPHDTHTPVETPAPEPKNKTRILEKATRFYDCSWENEAASKVIIPASIGERLLSEALELGKMAFYDFCKKNVPDLWKRRFQDSHKEVKFEYDENNVYECYWRFSDTPDVNRSYLVWALDKARILRNRVAHFSGHFLVHYYDEYLQGAQAISIAVKDEPRAVKIRALRDELRAVATDTLERIENMGCASLVQVQRDWEPCHDRFFALFTGDKYDGLKLEECKLSCAVGLALEAWRWQENNCDPMARDPEV
ncbi:26S proteasome subunit RPN7 [Apiospora arundinis]